MKTMTKKQLKQYAARFKREVTDRAEEVDPGSEYTWRGLVLGWAIGHVAEHYHESIVLELAQQITNYICNETDLA
jgi:hypothetical protein